MTHLYYSGAAASPQYPQTPLASLADRPPPAYELHKAGTYRPGPGLVAAANVAILLGQPLLLTGEPGTGKTQFAYALAKALKLGPVHECFVKSTTSARDLFYSFDELARFRDNQAGDPQPLQRYLSFNGLGRAILFAGGREHALERLPGLAFETAPSSPSRGGSLGLLKGPAPRAQRPQCLGDLYPPAAFPAAPAASLVLIDELDKAPRDTPNDMLNEIERLGFDIPELGVRVSVPSDPKTRPVIVITSNSEKSLPEPFLRRCVYHDIPFPGAALREIVYAQVKGLQGGEGALLTGSLLTDALALFDHLRDRNRIGRPPGTAELLSWIDTLLGAGLQSGDGLRAPLALALAEVEALAAQAAVLGEAPAEPAGLAPNLVESTLAVLVKKAEDRNAALDVIRQWVQVQPAA